VVLSVQFNQPICAHETYFLGGDPCVPSVYSELPRYHLLYLSISLDGAPQLPVAQSVFLGVRWHSAAILTNRYTDFRYT